MTDRPSQTTIRAWARLLKAQHLALSAVERDLKRAGLPPLTWYDVLLELERAGDEGLRPFELERAMLLAQYNLSRLVDRLERAGHVERRACEDDGRGQVIVATEKGLALRRKMWPVYARAIEAALGRHLSSRSTATLDDLLGQLIEGQRASAAT
ncbi:MAG: MarR family winged helix-turn-helix transcriptional regulator [Proteobacteria bacterium]|nr:MarR family winged helix-turn-helix transcriptional regulator [Pseudomonadota bacterium]